jgi:hypothetical protein
MTGFMFYLLGKMYYLFSVEILGLVMVALPTFILVYLLVSKRLIKLLDKVPPGKLLLLFIRRDGEIIPTYGTRPYAGESFIDVPKLGLLHDLGKGSVCRWGMNNVRFCLENVNHTPNPSYVNYTTFLHTLGFNNLKEVQLCIQGNGGYKEMQEQVKQNIPFYQAEPQEVLQDNILDAKPVPLTESKKVERKIDTLFRKKHEDRKGTAN